MAIEAAAEKRYVRISLSVVSRSAVDAVAGVHRHFHHLEIAVNCFTDVHALMNRNRACFVDVDVCMNDR